MADARHKCHAHGCDKQVPPRKFACRKHWFAVRTVLRTAILREYRPGQERDKQFSARYACVQRSAVAELAFNPWDEEAARISGQYLIESETWRKRAIETGEGDPLAGIDDRKLFDLTPRGLI